MCVCVCVLVCVCVCVLVCACVCVCDVYRPIMRHTKMEVVDENVFEVMHLASKRAHACVFVCVSVCVV